MDNKKITWSHSRMNVLLNNPREYYLNYVLGIKPKEEKTALSLGSAIHWLLENNTNDATPYYQEKGSFNQYNTYTDEQCLAECVADAFFRRKEEIYADILKDEESLEILEMIDVQKELELTCNIPSALYPSGHEFLGIIDLLLLTNKGFILIDYKTSSKDVDWDSYKSQLFKYKYLLNYNFPDMPLYKVGIINLKKTNIRRGKNESNDVYKRRIREQYLVDDNLINWHLYKDEEFSEEQLSDFVKDLSGMLDTCQMIIDHNLYFLNYSNIIGMYGPSQYYDIFYKTKSAKYLYLIKDNIFDENENKKVEYRSLEDVDLLATEFQKVLNKYSLFEKEVTELEFETQEELFEKLKKKYICSDKLLNIYWNTLNKNLKESEKK